MYLRKPIKINIWVQELKISVVFIKNLGQNQTQITFKNGSDAVSWHSVMLDLKLMFLVHKRQIKGECSTNESS